METVDREERLEYKILVKTKLVKTKMIEQKPAILIMCYEMIHHRCLEKGLHGGVRWLVLQKETQ